MNINKQMSDLGQMGAGNYEASDDVLNQLLTRTKRARAVRQSSAALASSMGAIALGFGAVQIIAHNNDDPNIAERDLDLIEDMDKPPVIQDFNDKYGNDIPTKESDPYDIKPVIEKLQAAAQAEEDKAAEEAEKAAAKAAADAEAKRKADQAAANKKHQDSKKGDTKKKDDGKHHSGQKAGFIEMGGVYYPIVQFTDAATGKSFFGALVTQYNKIGFADSLSSTGGNGKWVYITNNATFGGGQCTGMTATKLPNVAFQFTCSPNQSDWTYFDTSGKYEPWIKK